MLGFLAAEADEYKPNIQSKIERYGNIFMRVDRGEIAVVWEENENELSLVHRSGSSCEKDRSSKLLRSQIANFVDTLPFPFAQELWERCTSLSSKGLQEYTSDSSDCNFVIF